MPVIQVVVSLLVVGILAWLTNRYSPISGNIRVIINVVLALIVVGIFLWLINTYVPMAGSIRALLNIVVFVATCVLVLKAVGLWDRVVRIWSDLTHHRITG